MEMTREAHVSDVFFEPDAMLALQTASEDYLVDLFKVSVNAGAHGPSSRECVRDWPAMLLPSGLLIFEAGCDDSKHLQSSGVCLSEGTAPWVALHTAR
jgi:hypothetical protein